MRSGEVLSKDIQISDFDRASPTGEQKYPLFMNQSI